MENWECDAPEHRVEDVDYNSVIKLYIFVRQFELEAAWRLAVKLAVFAELS